MDPDCGVADIPGLSFRKILDLLPCYVSIQDERLHILYNNAAFVRDFGDGVGRLCHMVYKGSENKCEACPVQKTFRDREIHLSEETVQLRSGEINDMIVYSAPVIMDDGRVPAVMEVSTNITRIKHMQKELTFLGQSIALISHDIKNILEGLSGGVYVVDEGLKDRDAPLARKGWEIVKKNISDITAVAQNILFSSKKRQLVVQEVNPVEIVRETVAHFQERANEQGVTLRYEVNNLLPNVRLDLLSIRRMLRNLILNGIQACMNDPEDKPHRVTVRAVFHDEANFRFEVEDNGPGLTPEAAKNIFKEYFSTKGSAGTGLGLAVVDKIVGEHGGRIELLTEPGKGAIFRIILGLNKL